MLYTSDISYSPLFVIPEKKIYCTIGGLHFSVLDTNLKYNEVAIPIGSNSWGENFGT